MQGVTGSNDAFVKEGLRIVRAAEKEGVVLRVMGAVAIRIHCPGSLDLLQELGRDISDIDFVGYEKQTSKIEKLMPTLGYTSRQLSYSFVQAGRLIFLDSSDPTGSKHIDVFLDRLAMCHTIPYLGRLEVDSPTVPLAEILLQKTQIVQLSEKDVKDTMVLFKEHDIGANDSDTINIRYIAELLSKDWGFYYTVTTNLQKVKSLVSGFSVLSAQDRQVVVSRIDNSLARLDAEPKTSAWRMRAKVGVKKKWYKDVYSPTKL